MRWATVRFHAAAFFGATLDWAPGESALSALVPLLALPQAVHYVMDAWLWRFDGSNPGLRENLLGLAPTGAETRQSLP